MLAALSRYRILLIILSLIILAIVLWLFISDQDSNKPPRKGVFVISQTVEKS